jgi:hypothetical protein
MTHTHENLRLCARGRTWKSGFTVGEVPTVATSHEHREPAPKPTILPSTMRRLASFRINSRSAFSLAETVVAMAVTVVSLFGFYLAAGQAIRVVRSGKEMALASEILQQRIETFRFTPPWSDLTTVGGITAIVSTATQASQNLNGVTESFKVTPYPSGGTPLIVTRSPNGAITSSGPDLSTQRCVKLTVEASWVGTSRSQKTRQISTLVARGGL